jgi:hypothetical protein
MNRSGFGCKAKHYRNQLMSDAEQQQIKHFVLQQHTAAMAKKVSAGERYRKSLWKKVAVSALGILHNLPGSGRFDKKSEYAPAKLSLEDWHTHHWGYPVDIVWLDEAADGSLFGIY